VNAKGRKTILEEAQPKKQIIPKQAKTTYQTLHNNHLGGKK
jgi:hypothetical protein